MRASRWLPISLLLTSLLVMLVAAIAVPLYQFFSSDASSEAVENGNAAEAVLEAINNLGPTLEFLEVSLLGLQGFVAASFRHLPNISLPPAQRAQRIPLFSDFASTLIPDAIFKSKDVGFTFELHPGGVLSEMYPPNATATSLLADDFIIDNATTWSYINDGGIGAIIEVRSLDVDDGSFNSTVEIVGGIAVFGSAANISNWWGNIVVRLRMDRLVAALGLGDKLEQKGYNWCLVTGERVPHWVAGSSLPPLPGSGRTTTATVESTPKFVLSIRNKVTYRLATPTNVVLTIILGVFISLSVLAMINFLVYWHSIEYTGREHAPKYAPFALTVIAIDHGEELCRVVDGDTGTAMIDEFNRRVQTVLKNHRGFLSQSLLRHCHVIVTRSIDASVHLSYELIESLRDDPILVSAPNGFKTALRVLVTCHWCEDAAPVDEDLNYEGFDVLYAIKFFRSAAVPDRVVATRAAKELARGMRTVHVIDNGLVALRDIVEEQECFILVDPNSKQLRDALAEAADSSGALAGILPPTRRGSFLAGGPRASGSDFASSDHVEMRNSAPQLPGGGAKSAKTSGHFEPPVLPPIVEAGLKRAFTGPSELLDVEFDEVRVTLSTIYSALTILFDSFAASERLNILRRLASVNSLPVGPQLVDELSVRCLLQSKLVFNQRLGAQVPS